MGIEVGLHKIQKDILVSLLFKPGLRFSKLNEGKVASDQFNFHLKRLIVEGLVQKENAGVYCLTPKGKEFANRLDTETKLYEKQAKIGVLICCINRIKGETAYLIQQRLKEPYFGFYGFITGKVKMGETVFETAQRELKEETGLGANLKLSGVKHKMDYSKDEELLEDKFFFVIKATNPKGKMIRKFEGGKNLWRTKKEILKLENLFDGVGETINMASEVEIKFRETKYKVSKF